MKTYLFLAFALLLTCHLQAQTNIRKSSLTSGGGSYNTAHLHTVYTVGEFVVEESSTANTHLSEGFIGPDLSIIMGIETYNYVNNIQISPNPFENRLRLKFAQSGEYEIHIFDMNGRKWTMLNTGKT